MPLGTFDVIDWNSVAWTSHTCVYACVLVELGIVVHTCNSTTQEAETGELRIQSQTELYGMTLS